MKEKNKLNKVFLVAIFIILISMLTSCIYYEKKEEEAAYKANISEEGVVIILNKTQEEGVVIVLDNDTIVNISEKEAEEKEQEEQLEEEQVPARVSEVEFYFLLKGKSYFKHILKENQEKTYNISGYLVTIEPIFIGRDEVKFMINNYTTRALSEKDSDATPEFEIIVKDIYYRR